MILKIQKKWQKKRYLFKKHTKKYMIAENRLWYYFKYINKNHKKKNIKNISILVESDLKNEIKNMENDIIPNINKKEINKTELINSENNNNNFKDLKLTDQYIIKNMNITLNKNYNLNITEKNINYK